MTRFFEDTVAGWPIFVRRKQADGTFTSAGTIHVLTTDTAVDFVPQFREHHKSDYSALRQACTVFVNNLGDINFKASRDILDLQDTLTIHLTLTLSFFLTRTLPLTLTLTLT